MKIRRSRRQIATLSNSRWLAYATASAATALAGSNSLEAAIHYSGLLVVAFPPGETKVKTFQLDQPGDSFTLNHEASNAAGFSINGIASAGFWGSSFFYTSGGFVSAEKLHRGQRISNGYFFSPRYSAGVMALGCSYGQWLDPGIGFIGFKFNSGAGTQYGWARVRMAGCNNNSAFKLIDFAYADPGEAIGAGQGIPRAGEDDQDMSDEQGPEEGSLGWLAVGAVGLLAWRKNRSRTARLEDA
jgi:hypothetical protein